MQSFIRVIEVWTPSASAEHLEFNNGIYESLEGFGEMSKQETFSCGEGLPGKAWEQACPVVLKSFDEITFQRTKAAHEVGLTSGVAIPVFSGEELKAVLVFLCGDAKQPSGAIEVWQDDGLSGMALVDGYYGELEKFEWLSKRIKFQRGKGLPGLVWDTAEPLIADMANSTSFLRAKAAEDFGITTSIAIPVNSNQNIDDIGSVVTFLSSKSTPIAKRFEIWKMDESKECLLFDSGVEQDKQTVEGANPDRCIKKDEGVIGKTWKDGIPNVTSDLSNDPAASSVFGASKKYTSILTIPIFYQDDLRSVVALYN